MLTFFKRIRKGLLGEGVSSKYFLYAVGEIVLVVIGILIALQINNWNQWRKDRVKEKAILLSLEENLENNIQSLELDIVELALFGQSSNIILSILDNHLPYDDSLDVHFHYARVPKIPLSLSQAGYEQYKNTGYDIILDEDMKKEIIQLFESTYPKWFSQYDLINKEYVPFVDHHVPLFTFTPDKLKPLDMAQLYKDEYFIGWLRAYAEGRKAIIRGERTLIEENNRVRHKLRKR